MHEGDQRFYQLSHGIYLRIDKISKLFFPGPYRLLLVPRRLCLQGFFKKIPSFCFKFLSYVLVGDTIVHQPDLVNSCYPVL